MISILIMSLSANFVEGIEVKLISPIGAVARSAIPGWGQFYTHDRLSGVIIFLSIGIVGGFGIQADAEYRDYYYNKYRPEALTSPNSSKANSYFTKANDYYKLSRFLLYTAAGIWTYATLDSYVDAHIYNARIQSSMIDVDSDRFKPLK
jgi:hypothetical protein